MNAIVVVAVAITIFTLIYACVGGVGCFFVLFIECMQIQFGSTLVAFTWSDIGAISVNLWVSQFADNLANGVSLVLVIVHREFEIKWNGAT